MPARDAPTCPAPVTSGAGLGGDAGLVMLGVATPGDDFAEVLL
jgi:hypothetical protein